MALCSKQPIGLKVQVFANRPRNTPLCLLSSASWDQDALRAACRWERNLLSTAFRFHRGQEEYIMNYNKRVDCKLKKQFVGFFPYKPIHSCILERVYKRMWHERTSAPEIRAIRADRGPRLWEAVKDFPANRGGPRKAKLHTSERILFNHQSTLS